MAGTGTLHLIGLLSNGGVHSRTDQLSLILKVSKDPLLHYPNHGRPAARALTPEKLLATRRRC